MVSIDFRTLEWKVHLLLKIDPLVPHRFRMESQLYCSHTASGCKLVHLKIWHILIQVYPNMNWVMQMVLTVGTKLRYIITKMAVQYFEKHAVVEGIADVKPTDELFWFGRPHLILYLVHFILFQVDINCMVGLFRCKLFQNYEKN